MNREQAKEIVPVMQAYAEGKEVQYMIDDMSKWKTTDKPNFSDYLKWRVKPEPREWWVTPRGIAYTMEQYPGKVNSDWVKVREIVEE